MSTRCPDCDSGVLVRDGKCSKCHGTGVNTQLDSAQRECPYCKGTGICQRCGGSGSWREGEGIQTLFD